MRKSILFKIWGSAMSFLFLLGLNGVFAFVPSIGWAQSHSTLAFIISLIVTIGFGSIAFILWMKGIKEQKIEDAELIREIPSTLDALNDKRNETIKKIIKESGNDYGKMLEMNSDLWLYFTGIKVETITDLNQLIQEFLAFSSNPQSDNFITRLINNLKSGWPIMIEKFKLMSEIEICKLIHTFADKNIGIESILEQDRVYITLNKKLKYQREHFRSITGAKAIDMYINYSKGLNEMQFLLVSLEFIENAIKMGLAFMPQAKNINKIFEITAIYRSVPDRIQEQMNEQLSIVGEEINKYFKLNNPQISQSIIEKY
jgi:hypothetical protein